MENPLAYWMSFEEMHERMKTHHAIRSTVPTEHTISFPLPTRRWGEPAYACFACPALRRAGQPLRQGVPDRWWAIHARNGQLVVYALWQALPYASNVQWAPVTLQSEQRSIAEQEQTRASIGLLMDALVPSFFVGEAAELQTRHALKEMLLAYLPEPLLPWYRALVPDFFAWLEG
jgi:hypothetical protein